MAKFIPTSKNNPCPICADTKGRCRSKDDGKLFLLCMQANDARKGEFRNGFKCVNSNGRNTWASTWVQSEEDDNEYSPELVQKYHQQREKEERRYQNFLKSGLRRKERSENIKRLSQGLGLSQEHRRALQARGLSNHAINSGLFFTAKPGQNIPKGIDPKTPGVSFGNKLAIGQTSLACPAFDPQGNPTGYQLRLDEATGGRYRWPKGKYPSHLCNGELPLTVARPVTGGNPKAIALVEGVLKPYVAAQIHQRIFIGASGANFTSSREQLRLYLEQISRELETKVVEFWPDSGAVSNVHVVRSYRKSFDLLESFGFDVVVIWWGQAKKIDGDCDEITADTPIQSLSLLEFENICIQHGGYIPSVEKPKEELTEQELEQQWKEEFYRKVTAAQRPLRTLTYKPDLVFTPEDGRYLPSLIEKIPESGILWLDCPKGVGKSVSIREIKDYLCHGQRKTGEIVDGVPIVEFIDGLSKRFNSTTPRIALGREQSIRWIYTWLGDISANEETTIDGIQANVINSIDDTGSTFDSFWKLSGRDFSNTVWVLDECELGLSHLALSSTLKSKRPLILRLFGEKIKECLENGGLVILSDADLTDISLDYIRNFCPNAPVFGVQYQGNPEPWDVNFYTGKKDEVLQEIIDWFDPELNPDNQDPIHIFVDNKEEGQALEQILLKKYPELASQIAGIIRIDSSVTQTDFGRSFVERPNKAIEELKPRCLISTQSLGVGVSIDIPWFKHVFGLCFGTSEPSQARQGLARVRQNVPRSIWAADKGKLESGLRGSFFPEEIKNNLFSHHESTSELIGIAHDLAAQSVQNQCDAEFLPAFIKTLESMMGVNKSWDNPHLDLMAKFQARRNYSLSQFALQLRQELIDEGNNVTDFGCVEESAIGEWIKEQKEENRIKESQAITEAPDITEEEAKKILKSPSATEEKLRSATKAMLKKELPGVELTPEFVHRAFVGDKGRWKNSVRLYWSCQNLEATKERDLANWRYKLKQFSEGAVYIPDIKTLSLQCRALTQSGIFTFIEEQKNSQVELIDESPEMRGFLDWGEANKRLLERAFGMKSGKSPIRFVNQLLGKVGLSLKVTRTQKLPNGNKLRWYSFDTEVLADPDRIAILEALDRRWQIRQEEKAQREQAWLDQQAIASQEPVSHSLESQGGGEQIGVTSSPIYKTIGVRDTACDSLGEGDAANSEHSEATAGVSQPVAVVSVETLRQVEEVSGVLPYCQSAEDLRAIAVGYSVEVVESAIALQNTAPARAKLRQWFEQLTELSPPEKPSMPADASTEFVRWGRKLGQSYQTLTAQLSQQAESGGEELSQSEASTPERPPISSYREGEEVWAYFPQAEQKWLRAVVQKVCVGFLRVKSGFNGMLIERSDMIAPGDWVLGR